MFVYLLRKVPSIGRDGGHMDISGQDSRGGGGGAYDRGAYHHSASNEGGREGGSK